MKALTQFEYEKGNRATVCPACKSGNIEAKVADMDGDCGKQAVECLGCGATWQDILVVTGYTNLVKPS